MTTDPYTLRIVSAARRHLSADLPAAVAFAAHEFIKGPLLHNPYRADEKARTVTVLAVDPRGEIYRPG